MEGAHWGDGACSVWAVMGEELKYIGVMPGAARGLVVKSFHPETLEALIPARAVGSCQLVAHG